MKAYKKYLTTLSTLLLMLILCSPGYAAVPSYLPYPSSDPVIINPYGANDESAHLLDAMLPFYRIAYGRSFKIEEMPGRGGATAWGALADKPDDGYTLAVVNLQSFILRGMASRQAFRLDEIACTNVVAEAPLVLWVPESSPFPNILELMRSAKAYPNQLIIAGAGSGSQPHLATLRLNFFGGVKTIYLPYIGTVMAMESTELGQAHAAWGFPLPDTGKKLGMRPLAVAAKERLSNMPEVPTFEESNLALFESADFGLALPSSTPGGTRQSVAAHFGSIISGADFQESIKAMGFTPKSVSGQELNDLMQNESARLTELREQFDME